MHSRPAILSLLAAAHVLIPSALAQTPGETARGADPPAGNSVGVSLETDLTDEILAGVPETIRLPARHTAEFYRDTFGAVLAHLRRPDHPVGFIEWITVPGTDAPPPIDRVQLRQDAARLARVRLRRTAAVRKEANAPFIAYRDLFAQPDFYSGRPFTVWGHVRRVTPLTTAGGPDTPVLYELLIEPLPDPDRPMIVAVPGLPDGFPTGDEIREAVTVTGYVFQAIPGDKSADDNAVVGDTTFMPLVIAPSVTWHQAELSPSVRQALIASVRHRLPHRREEVNDFHRILRHAQLADYGDQQAAARRLLRERIEQLPRDSRADLEYRLRAIAEARRSNPGDADALKRREAQARTVARFEQRAAIEARENPEAFPLYAHVFQSGTDSADPHRYTGRPVAFSGHIRKHVSYPADSENEYGVTWLHEIWLYPRDADANPIVVMCTSVPEGLPVGEDLLESASVTGYFYKLWAYPARDTNRVVPMLLAQRVEWHPRREPKAAVPREAVLVIWCVLGVAGIAIAWALWRMTRRRRPSGNYTRAAQDETPDFSELS